MTRRWVQRGDRPEDHDGSCSCEACWSVLELVPPLPHLAVVNDPGEAEQLSFGSAAWCPQHGELTGSRCGLCGDPWLPDRPF